MKKFLSVMIITLFAFLGMTACSSGSNPLVNKTFTDGTLMVGESDVSAEFENRIKYSFYESTFIFEIDYDTVNYSYFLGSYEYNDGNVTLQIDKTVGQLSNTSDNKLKAFQVRSLVYEDNNLIVNTEIDGVSYMYTLS